MSEKRWIQVAAKLQPEDETDPGEGRLTFMLVMGAQGTLGIQSACVEILDRQNASQPRAFDGGHVIVSFDADGQHVSAVEFLAPTKLAALPQFRSYVAQSSESTLLRKAHGAALLAWPMVRLAKNELAQTLGAALVDREWTDEFREETRESIAQVFAEALKYSATRADAVASAARILDATPGEVAAEVGLDGAAMPRRGGPRKGESGWRPRGRARSPRSTCVRGHSLDDAYVRSDGARRCRVCHRERVRVYEKKRQRRQR